MIRSFAFVVAVLLACPVAYAAEDTVRRHFVIVGNNHSIDGDIEDLQYADDDAVLFYRLFAPFAARIDLLTVLDDVSQARHRGMAKHARLPTRAELRNVLKQNYQQIQLGRTGGQRTELTFVFVGHGGLDDEGKGFVHLADGRFSRADLFRDIIKKSPADVTHVILDACNAFSLVAGRGPKKERKVDPTFARFLSGHDLEKYPSVGVLVATSDSRETHEWSRIGGGVFSYQVRSALAGAADINRDNRVEYSEVAAFVDAANAELPAAGKRISTFAWPPRRDRSTALLDLRAAPGLRRVIIDQPVTGRLFLETESGERWAGFHAAGERVVVHAPAGELLFLRDGGREVEIDAGTDDVWIRDAPEASYTVAQRGAVDRAFERALFAIPFDRAYYRGYVGGRRHLVAVQFVAAEVDEDPGLPGSMGVGGGYVLGKSVFRQELDHGAFVRVDLPISEGLSLSPTVEWGMTGLENDNHVHRVILMPALSYRYPWRRVAVQGGLAVGWGVLAISGGSADYTLGVVRGSLGVEVRLSGNLWLAIEGSYTGYVVTVDDEEMLRTTPQGTFGLVWR